MKIDKAIKLAAKQGRGISRKAWGTRPTLILPTNTTSGLLGIPFDEKAPIQRGWMPNANDLTAKDWVVYG